MSMSKSTSKRLLLVGVLLGLLQSAGTAYGQFQTATPKGAAIGEVGVQRWEIGFIFEAPAGPVRNIVATQSVLVVLMSLITILRKTNSPLLVSGRK